MFHCLQVKMADQVEVAAVPAEAPKKAVKVPKAKKPKAAGVQKLSYREMISGAITGLKEKTGSSRQAINGYIAANYDVPQEKARGYILSSLKKGVSEGAFKSAKASGKGAGKYKLVAVAPKKKSLKAKAAKKPAAKKVKKVAAKKSKKPLPKKMAKKSSAKAAKKPKAKMAAKKPVAKKAKKPVAKKSASKKPAKK